MEFKEDLYGERLVLGRTRPTRKMAKLIFLAVDESREHLRLFCPWEKNDDSVESVLNYLKNKEVKTGEGERVEYGIFLRESGEYIGNIQVFDISPEKRSGEIGYWLKKSATGKGYMREALRILEKYCFTELGLYRLQLGCDTRNRASAAVIAACGYRFEGLLRGDRKGISEDSTGDSYLFAKTRSDHIKDMHAPRTGKYRIVSMQKHPGGIAEALAYYQGKWGRKENYAFFEDAIRHPGDMPRRIPQFFVLLKGKRIVGCCGLIMNDFVSRNDLYPWLCGLYVEEKERGKALGYMLMRHAEWEAELAGFRALFITTDHIGYYERYGWEFLGTAYEPSGAGTRIYKKTL
ncbi:MAG: GNAT family N-acetyltransferase [Candidatus Neomarinimicrobiota bacterium]|jgi:RimJ/RimL family protein N-acetyltransferase/N-acetylglutamate synthase-like GNAT family acetyltransferase|nr:GNAT family N-acetyltransferase [Candidatus Neomarinimicrobiota bacterium]MDD3966533.1 GNAT family N-acetyltransferase [Candidatus Neomarinimicrobiota bacterium]MDX9780280.1 GNAT family N-acetyltransferase [bacterium]